MPSSVLHRDMKLEVVARVLSALRAPVCGLGACVRVRVKRACSDDNRETEIENSWVRVRRRENRTKEEREQREQREQSEQSECGGGGVLVIYHCCVVGGNLSI